MLGQIAQLEEKLAKTKEKLKVSEAKAKRVTVAEAEAKRKHQMWLDKQKELDAMRAAAKEVQDLKDKLAKVNATNSDLVTRKCALQSAVANKDKEIQELTDRLQNAVSDSRVEQPKPKPQAKPVEKPVEKPQKQAAPVSKPKPEPEPAAPKVEARPKPESKPEP